MELREFTIAMGGSEVHVNLARSIEVEGGQVLYEAFLADPNGSRMIWIDRDDLAACLKSSPILRPAPAHTVPPHGT